MSTSALYSVPLKYSSVISVSLLATVNAKECVYTSSSTMEKIDTGTVEEIDTGTVEEIDTGTVVDTGIIPYICN